METNKGLWQRVDELRKIKDISVRQMSEEIGIAERSLQSTRIRNQMPKVIWLYKFAKYFGVNMEYLFKVREHGGSGKFITPDTANKHLRLRCAQHNIVVGDRTQYCFRHTFNTASLGTLPETARLILMGHTANRQEYNHLTPRQALERVLSIEGVKEALDIETTKK